MKATEYLALYGEKDLAFQNEKKDKEIEELKSVRDKILIEKNNNETEFKDKLYHRDIYLINVKEKLNKATCLLGLKGYTWQQEKRLWINY